jgi:hypothetical protein
VHPDLREHYDNALRLFSDEDNYKYLLEAQKEYFDLTGKVHEEDYNYENRMNAFHDWYLLQFISRDGRAPAIEIYMRERGIDGEIKRSFLEFHYTLLEFKGTSLRGHYVVDDLITGKKITLSKNHPKLSLIKGEVFIARVLTYNNESFLMNGLCVLPEEAIGIVKKQAKFIKKKKNYGKENMFLLVTESLNTKWQRYGHVDVKKIFVYPEL